MNEILQRRVSFLVRDHLVGRWIRTHQHQYESDEKVRTSEHRVMRGNYFLLASVLSFHGILYGTNIIQFYD